LFLAMADRTTIAEGQLVTRARFPEVARLTLIMGELNPPMGHETDGQAKQRPRPRSITVNNVLALAAMPCVICRASPPATNIDQYGHYRCFSDAFRATNWDFCSAVLPRHWKRLTDNRCRAMTWVSTSRRGLTGCG